MLGGMEIGVIGLGGWSVAIPMNVNKEAVITNTTTAIAGLDSFIYCPSDAYVAY